MFEGLQPSQYETLLALIHKANRAASYEELSNIYTLAKQNTHIQGLLFGFAPDLDEEGLKKNRFIAFGFPMEWVSAYHSENFALTDPVVLYSIEHPDAVFEWREAYEAFSKQAELSSLNKFSSTGTYFGMTVATHNLFNRLPTITSVLFGTAEPNENTLAFYRHLLPALNEIIARPQFRDRPEMSDKEIAVLKWINQGKTYWESAQILGLSERTIKYHMANISRKLGVTNKGHVISKAVQLGLIPPNIQQDEVNKEYFH